MSDRSPIRVLYMEDDLGLGRLVQKKLSRDGYVVDVARNGKEGLAMHAEGDYDVVLLDQEMPIYNGLKVLKLLAAHQQSPPTIMLTGSGDEETAVEAMKLGASDYLIKDPGAGYLDLLPARIERVITQRRLVEERRRAEEALKESEERFRAVAETAVDAIVTIDSRGTIIFWNNGAKTMFGYPQEEVIGTQFMRLISTEYHQTRSHELSYFQLTDEPRREQRIESKGIQKDGTQFPIELSLTSWETKQGTFHTAIIRDITERKEYEEKLSHMAHHDALTGVYNRYYLAELLDQEISRAKRYNHPLGLLMIDVNRFKEINDRFGHQVGDKVLQKIAASVMNAVRETDIVVRYGGDEFLIICPETGGETKRVKARIQEEMARDQRATNIVDFPITLSIGSAYWKPDSPEPIDKALAQADARMYAEKRARGQQPS